MRNWKLLLLVHPEVSGTLVSFNEELKDQIESIAVPDFLVSFNEELKVVFALS